MNATRHIDALQFGDFTLTLKPLHLDREGEVVELRNQALVLLLLLVENADELVSHEDIRQHLWGDQHVDFARGTHVCIRQIRGALGDDAGHPAFIETLPRQGYRFIAPVSRIARSDRIERAKSGRRAQPRRRIAVAGITAVAATLGLVLFIILVSPPASITDTEEASPARAATLKGEYLLDTGGRKNTKKSAEQFARALSLDPDYLPARAGRAQVAILEGEYSRAETELRAVLDADPTFAAAYMHRGLIAAERDWNWHQAVSFIDQAIDLDPQLAKAYSAKAAMMLIMGRTDDALRATSAAHAIDPVSALIKTDHGWFHYYAGQFEAAKQFCTEAEELAPESTSIATCQLKIATATHDLRAQARAGARILALHGAEAELQNSLQGDDPTRDDVDAFFAWHLARILSYAAEGKVSPEGVAGAYAEAGDFEMAAAMLEKASKERSVFLPLFLRDPVFKPLYAEPRFLAALAEAGMPAPELM